ncbi:MAG: hypothetical protein PHH28_01595 [Desulfuromonadaceae bacterium]|nr:hypothetical protein [Desulfuromonadaceae bacterium]
MRDIEDAKAGRILSKFMKAEYFQDFLRRKSLALVNPALWPDKNDAKGIELYKEKTNTTLLLATCLTYASETSHHWANYGKELGVRVIFNKALLLKAIPADQGYRSGKIEYLKLKDFENDDRNLNVHDIPFYKRRAYRDEREFRIIWTGQKSCRKIKYLEVSEAIEKVVFDATVSDNAFNEFRKNIHEALQRRIPVTKTTVSFSRGWLKRIGELC